MTVYLSPNGADRTEEMLAYLSEKRRYRARAIARFLADVSFMADVTLPAPLPPKTWTPPTPAAPALLEAFQ